ncbi:MAG: hypothetical protein WC333_02145 [Dehalococcoidia bacterium]
MKADIEVMLFDIYHHIGIDKPTNHEEIVDFVFNDVAEAAGIESGDFHSGDVAIGFRRWMESKPTEQNIYLLFGEQAVRAYEDGGVEAAVESVKNGEGSVYHWNSNRDNPMSLLGEADGWEDYTEITKEEYDQF